MEWLSDCSNKHVLENFRLYLSMTEALRRFEIRSGVFLMPYSFSSDPTFILSLLPVPVGHQVG